MHYPCQILINFQIKKAGAQQAEPLKSIGTCLQSSVDFFPVGNGEDLNQTAVFFDAVYNPVVTYSYSVKIGLP